MWLIINKSCFDDIQVDLCSSESSERSCEEQSISMVRAYLSEDHNDLLSFESKLCLTLRLCATNYAFHYSDSTAESAIVGRHQRLPTMFSLTTSTKSL